MIDERENNFAETDFGSLTLRHYDISGNDVDAFYDNAMNLVFVLDKTINQSKPNVLLVINPLADKKWDEILSTQYGVDLENIRPKVDNKYQKLDIEYSGLGVYKNLIDAFVNGDALNEHLVQLDILRDSAMRHSAMLRLNAANEIISKSNATIVKTKESIVRLQQRLKTLRAKLSEQKKTIGRVSTKQSAAKILKLESMIEATNEKLKRAEKRLESAQKRLDVATVDAELATDLLAQPNREIKSEINGNDEIKNKPLMAAPRYDVQTTEPESDEYESDNLLPEPQQDFDKDDTEMDEEKDVSENSEIKPLLDKDPEIINEEIAFKPISFDVPELVVSNEDETGRVPESEDVSANNDGKDDIEDKTEDKNVTESVAESKEESDEDVELDSDFNLEQRPVLESMTPVSTEPAGQQYDEDIAQESETFTEDTDFNAPALGETDESESMPQEKGFDEKFDEKSDDNLIQKPRNLLDDEDADTKKDTEIQSAENLIRPLPVAPVANNVQPKPIMPYESKATTSKPSIVYYVLLLVLIVLSVVTLWLYQKNMGNGKPSFFDKKPVAEEISDKPQPQVNNNLPAVNTDVFFDDKPVQRTVAPVADKQPVVVEPESTAGQDVKPVVVNSVSANITSFSGFQSDEKPVVENKSEVVINKPVYDAGSRYDEMFVYEEDQDPVEYVDEQYVEYEPEYYYEEADDNTEYVEEQFVETGDTNDSDTIVTENDANVQPVAQKPERIVYNGDDIYADDNYYEEDFDEEEAAYQAGYDGYEQY